MKNLECNALVRELNESEKLEIEGGIPPILFLGIAVLAITAGNAVANSFK